MAQAHIPGTRALRTFEAAARHLNFTRAADEVGLTPAAISHQIKEIEDQLGVTLFSRTSRTIRLTEAGEVMLDAAVESLDLLARAVVKARRTQRGSSLLRVTLEATFLARWLMPRMAEFRKSNPDVDLRFDISESLRDFDRDDVDVGIRFGAGNYPGVVSHRLFDNVVIPVCTPRLIANGPPLNEPRDLFKHTLCEVDWTAPGMTWPNWRMWMAAAGIEDFDDSGCIVFQGSAHAVQAAIDGDAVALVEFEMVADDISAGKLVQPFCLGLTPSPEYAYYLVYPERSRDDPRIVAFRDWVLAQVRRTKLDEPPPR